MLTCFSVFLGALGGSWVFRAPVLLCLGSPLVVRSRVSKFFTAFFPLFIFHYESPPLIFACPDLFYRSSYYTSSPSQKTNCFQLNTRLLNSKMCQLVCLCNLFPLSVQESFCLTPQRPGIYNID